MSESKNRPTWPWTDKGWYGQESKQMDPHVRKLIVEAGGGRVNPIGYWRESPAASVSLATHNPYFAFFYAMIFGLVGFFVFGKMQEVPWAAWLVGGLFWASAALIIGVSARRAPAWHRARRLVRDYLSVHHGEFPRQLRWYT